MIYQLKVISLEGCPYSQNTEKLLTDYKYNLVRINAKEKEKYKTDKIKTFPQIYLEKNGQAILLGGNNDLEDIMKIIKLKNLEQMKNGLKTKYPELSIKTILRLIEVFLG